MAHNGSASATSSSATVRLSWLVSPRTPNEPTRLGQREDVVHDHKVVFQL